MRPARATRGWGGSGAGWGLLPLVLLVAVVGFLPYAAALRDSFFHEVYGERSLAGLDNYRFLLHDRALFLSAAITFAWAAIEALLATAMGWGLALLLFESKRGGGLVYAALLVPWAVPSYIGVPIWRMLIHGAGGDSLLSQVLGFRMNLLTDPVAGFAAAVFVSAWMGAPIVAFLIYGALRKLPAHVVEAARLDGAGRSGLSRLIYRPLVGPTILTVLAFEFVKAFKEFQVPFLLTGGGPPLLAGITERTVVGATTTLEIYLYDLFQGAEDYGLAAAYATVAGAILVLLTALAFFLTRKARRASGPGGGEGLPSRPRPGLRPGGRASDLLSWMGRWVLGWGSVAAAILVLFALAHMAFSGLSSTYVDSFLPRFPTGGNFGAIFREDGVGRAFLNTLWVSLVTALLAPLLVFPAALRLKESSPGTRVAVFAALQALGSAGGMHSLVPLYALARSLGLADSYLPVIAVYLFHAAPLALFAVTAFLDDLPASFAEGARLEGCGRGPYLFRVVLPLSWPVMATTAMTAFLAAWNGFLAPLLFLNDDSKYTIGIRLFTYVGSVASGNPKWNRFAAASIVNLAIVGFLLWRLKGPLGRTELSSRDD